MWNSSQKVWSVRKRDIGKQVGRIPVVPRNNKSMEKYALRILLHNVGGAKSFEDLKRVNDELFPTFHAAAIAHGLMDDDKEKDKAMDEAAEVKT